MDTYIIFDNNPDPNHGAGIFTQKTGWFRTRANVDVHIPAPWYGINILLCVG